jgi:hypothetical protein
MDRHLEVARFSRTEFDQLTCPCGEGPPLDLQRDVTPTRLHRWVHHLIQRATATPSVTPSPPTSADVCDRAFTDRCPWCDMAFCGFDGCVAVFCECRRYFCGLCLARCSDSTDAHAHGTRCRYNPTLSYYVPTDLCTTNLRRRSLLRLAETLEEVRSTHGILHALRVMRGVRHLRSDDVGRWHLVTGWASCVLWKKDTRTQFLRWAWDEGPRRGTGPKTMIQWGYAILVWMVALYALCGDHSM